MFYLSKVLNICLFEFSLKFLLLDNVVIVVIWLLLILEFWFGDEIFVIKVVFWLIFFFRDVFWLKLKLFLVKEILVCIGWFFNVFICVVFVVDFVVVIVEFMFVKFIYIIFLIKMFFLMF